MQFTIEDAMILLNQAKVVLTVCSLIRVTASENSFEECPTKVT